MENIVQAISRDILADAMMLAHTRGAEIVLHVHDEIGTLKKKNDAFGFGLKDLHYCMTNTPFWAPGLPLGAAGFSGKYYKK
jgi:DNA polymerase